MNSSEIAKIAGVSRSTVSRVINNYNNVPEETRTKILEIIEKYNYVPIASAQILAGKKNKTIGLFIVDTKNNEANKMMTSTYFSPFTNALIDASSKQGYNVLVSMINKDIDFKKAKDIFYSKSICGGIFIGANNKDLNIQELIDASFIVSLIEQERANIQGSNTKSLIINSKSFDGAYEAVSYLIKKGHKKIAHITGDINQLTAIQRLQGYKKALEDNNIKPSCNLIIKGDYTEASGYNALKKLLQKSKPTAIFIANDCMALGAIKAINELNLKIPEDLSIIGFDDIELARYIKPSLSTVKIPFEKMAELSAIGIINANEQKTDNFSTIELPVELIIRETT